MAFVKNDLRQVKCYMAFEQTDLGQVKCYTAFGETDLRQVKYYMAFGQTDLRQVKCYMAFMKNKLVGYRRKSSLRGRSAYPPLARAHIFFFKKKNIGQGGGMHSN